MHLTQTLLLIASVGLFSAACDGGGSEGAVADLSDPELEELCEQFHDDACPTSTDDFCAATCRATCKAAGTAALVKQNCTSPITVAQVNTCAELFGSDDPSAFDVCMMGGGCVFDVFDETCP